MCLIENRNIEDVNQSIKIITLIVIGLNTIHKIIFEATQRYQNPTISCL